MNDQQTSAPKTITPITALLLCAALFIIMATIALTHTAAPAPVTNPIIVPDFSVPLGKARPPLPYRIISFHRGRADKNLIKLAAQLGFNGVQFQIEGSNLKGLADFAARDAKEHLVDYCHSLHMKVTLWVHEFSDLPGPWMPNYLGKETAADEPLWAALDARYETILTSIVPNIDGLALTVVETEVRATDPDVMLRLVKLIAAKCAEHHKSLIVRTFVWYSEEFQHVMAAISKLPAGTVIMTKVVPQDWQMHGANNPAIGNVGGRPQIIEYDACGEYFLRSTVANCMVDLLKKQFDYDLSKNIQGICVRVDRDNSSVLFEPNEVNLWALGLLAGGVTDSADDIWNRWAQYRYERYGKAAASAVIRALKPTAQVVAELLSVGPFTFGDTRQLPPLPDDPDTLLMNWQNWRWDSAYLPDYYKAAAGDPAFTAHVAAQKAAAMKLADRSLADLEAARKNLPGIEYQILYTKLLTNKTQLAIRTPMVLAMLEYNALRRADSERERNTLSKAMRHNINRVRAIAATLGQPPLAASYLNKTWLLNQPENINPEDLYRWAYYADLARQGKHFLPLPEPLRGPDELPPNDDSAP